MLFQPATGCTRLHLKINQIFLGISKVYLLRKLPDSPFLKDHDFVREIFTASTHDTILFFSNKGKLYRLRGYEIPEAGRTAKGTAIVNLLSLDPGEKITAVIPISNFAEGKYLLMATQKGFIKKTAS